MFCLECVIRWKVAQVMASHLWKFEHMEYHHPDPKEWKYTYRLPSTSGANGANIIAEG